MRTATLTRNLSGKFTNWKEGEIVRVHQHGRLYGIEKLHRKPSGVLKEGLPLFNELAGVPRSAIKFHSARKNGKLK